MTTTAEAARPRAALFELDEIEALAAQAGTALHCRSLCQVHTGGAAYPVYALTLGNPAPECAAVGFFGGVHGLEHIGAQVVLACLRGIVARLAWDDSLQHLLEHLLRPPLHHPLQPLPRLPLQRSLLSWRLTVVRMILQL